LAWVLSRGEHVTPIPGTTNIAHLEEDLKGDVALTLPLVAQLDRLMDKDRVTGRRYNAAAQAEVDTEQFDV
jgi:aryl-alcohol dehydrogenase-like predicted oxidoreductase